MKEAFAGYWQGTAGILVLALTLRLFFVLACPHVAGDSPIYEAFARNLLEFGTYSHLAPENQAAPRPTWIRVPGYPLLIAATFAIAGKGNETAIRIVQAFLDVGTCLLIALIAFEISAGPISRRRRIARRALLLSAVCPFVANYAASILTEVPATLLWSAATLFGLKALKTGGRGRNWLYCGLLTGGATLFRPESGILIGIMFSLLLVKDGLQKAWTPILAGAVLMGTGLALALLPWTVRNAVTLRAFQCLAPTFAQDTGEMVPTGYWGWCKTWLWTYRDITRYWFPLETEPLPTTPLPFGSYDNEAQKEMLRKLILRHNQEGNVLEASSDRAFEGIARQRRIKHPMRQYAGLPILRSVAMWFTPRVEILNLEGRLWPMKEAWESDPRDFSYTLLLFLVNAVYIALGILGGISILKRSRLLKDVEFLGLCTLLAIIIARTAFFALFAFPEPRYVLEAYPGVIVLGAFAFGEWKHESKQEKEH